MGKEDDDAGAIAGIIIALVVIMIIG